MSDHSNLCPDCGQEYQPVLVCGCPVETWEALAQDGEYTLVVEAPEPMGEWVVHDGQYMHKGQEVEEPELVLLRRRVEVLGQEREGVNRPLHPRPKG